MKRIVKYIFIMSIILGYLMSLKPCENKKIKVIRYIKINLVPSFNNHGMNKADSG